MTNLVISSSVQTRKEYSVYPEAYVPLKKLLEVTEETETLNTWMEYYRILSPNVFTKDTTERQVRFFLFRKDTVTPSYWRAMSKYYNAYASDWWESTTKDGSKLPAGNCLDFGAGKGKPWDIIPKETELYLVEINDSVMKTLEDTYKDTPNVHLITNLSEVAHLKFQYIYSRDALEHVRYINEHIWILFRLLELDGTMDLTIGSDDVTPDDHENHTRGFYQDSVLRPPWRKDYVFAADENRMKAHMTNVTIPTGAVNE